MTRIARTTVIIIYISTGKKQLDLAEQVVDICIAHTSTTTIASYPPCAENYVIVIIIAAEVPASLLLSPATILWPLMAGEMRNENDEGPYH